MINANIPKIDPNISQSKEFLFLLFAIRAQIMPKKIAESKKISNLTYPEKF
jgi:hypothetical protein